MYNAIVWQCRRTAPLCEELRGDGWEEKIREKTGLLIDAYFSGTKLQAGSSITSPARESAPSAASCSSATVDSWLIWNLTGGRVHVTDYSNCFPHDALRHIHTLQWDAELCEALSASRCVCSRSRCPTPKMYGTIDWHMPGLEDALRHADLRQRRATSRRPCSDRAASMPGEAKNTYGTGCFTMMNTGPTVPVQP